MQNIKSASSGFNCDPEQALKMPGFGLESDVESNRL
jgi:hypothetical protein